MPRHAPLFIYLFTKRAPRRDDVWTREYVCTIIALDHEGRGSIAGSISAEREKSVLQEEQRVYHKESLDLRLEVVLAAASRSARQHVMLCVPERAYLRPPPPAQTAVVLSTRCFSSSSSAPLFWFQIRWTIRHRSREFRRPIRHLNVRLCLCKD
jgi:hypothetical protein